MSWNPCWTPRNTYGRNLCILPRSRIVADTPCATLIASDSLKIRRLVQSVICLGTPGEVAVLATRVGFHRVQRAHAAVLLQADAARSPEVFSRRFIGTSKEASHHDSRGAELKKFVATNYPAAEQIPTDSAFVM